MKTKLKLTAAAIGLLFANAVFAQQVTDLCDRVKSAGKEAATKKISERVTEARKAYRLYKDLRKECQDFINAIPIAEISQMGTVTPAVSPAVTAAIKVAVEEYVIPEVQDKIRSVCKDVNDAYKNKVEEFEDKVIPPPVAKTGREAERRIKDWEKELEKTENEKDAPQRQTSRVKAASLASFKFEGKQGSLVSSVTASPEFKAYSKENPFKVPVFEPSKQVKAGNIAIDDQSSPITSAYEQSLEQPKVERPSSLPAIKPSQSSAVVGGQTALPAKSNATQTQSKPAPNAQENKKTQERSNYFTNMFGGK